MAWSEEDLKKLQDLSRSSPNAAVDPNLLGKLKQELDRRGQQRAALGQLQKEVNDHQVQADHTAKFGDKGTRGTLQELGQQVQQGAAQKTNIKQIIKENEDSKVVAEKFAKPEHQTGAV
jgi:hypothetical protein